MFYYKVRKINKYCKLVLYDQNTNYGIDIWAKCSDPIKLVNEFIHNINNKKIIPINNEISDIVVYASKENIEKMKTNKKNYFDIQKEYNNTINYYEKRVSELEGKINDYETKLYEYEENMSELNSQIEEYKSTIKSYENE